MRTSAGDNVSVGLARTSHEGPGEKFGLDDTLHVAYPLGGGLGCALTDFVSLNVSVWRRD